MWAVHSDVSYSNFPTSSPILNTAAHSSSRLKVFLSWFAVFALCLILPSTDKFSDLSVWVLLPGSAGDFGNVDAAVMPKEELLSLGSVALMRRAEHLAVT